MGKRVRYQTIENSDGVVVLKSTRSFSTTSGNVSIKIVDSTLWLVDDNNEGIFQVEVASLAAAKKLARTKLIEMGVELTE